MKKSNKGFTLVELIVVIAIIGILAAILVPAMIGYIRDSKLSSANSSAKTVYNAAMAFAQKCVNAGEPLGVAAYSITLDKAGAITDAQTPVAADMKTGGAYATDAGKAIGVSVCSSLNKDAVNSVAVVVIGDKGFPVDVLWAKGKTDQYVGKYPEAMEKPIDGGIGGITASDITSKAGITLPSGVSSITTVASCAPAAAPTT